MATSENSNIKSLDISSCDLTDEVMPQIASLVIKLESLDLHNSEFSVDGIHILVKYIKENGFGKLKSLNLRLCKLNEECLEVLSDIIPGVGSVTLSANNFSGTVGHSCNEDSSKILGGLCNGSIIEGEGCLIQDQ